MSALSGQPAVPVQAAPRMSGLKGGPSGVLDLESERLIRQHPLFRVLSREHFRRLMHRSRMLRLRHRELIYRQDSRAQCFYLILGGRVRLYRLDQSGTERTLDSHGPGECFAEVMIYAQPAHYACYAEVLGRSWVLAVPIDHYRTLLREHPEYSENALNHYATKAINRFHDLEIMTVQNARARLIRYLLDLIPENAMASTARVQLPLPKCLIASRLAMQPETFSRLLNELRSSGLISVEKDRLTLHDTDALLTMSK